MANIRGIYPGSFDPVHNGHLDIIRRAARLVDELVVGVYDHGKPIKSVVFSVAERVALIEENVKAAGNIRVIPYGGLTVDFARNVEAQVIIRGLRVFSDFEFEFRMALANQRLAPEIEVMTLMSREEHTFLSSTTVREIAYFQGNISTMVPPNVQAALHQEFHKDSTNGAPPAISLRD